MNDWVTFWAEWDADIAYRKSSREELRQTIEDGNFSEILFEKSIANARKHTENMARPVDELRHYFFEAVITNYHWLMFWAEWDTDITHQESLREDLRRCLNDRNFSETLLDQSIATARKYTENSARPIRELRRYFFGAVIRNYRGTRMRGLYGERLAKPNEVHAAQNQADNQSRNHVEHIEHQEHIQQQQQTLRDALTQLSQTIQKGKITYDPWGVFLINILQKISSRIIEDLSPNDGLAERVERLLCMTEQERHLRIQQRFEILEHLWARFATRAQNTEQATRQTLVDAIRQHSHENMNSVLWNQWTSRSQIIINNAAKAQDDPFYTNVINVLWKGGQAT